MNCDQALMSLLDAELPELTAGTSALAMHVRGCPRCRRVADRLMADTHRLAAAMRASGARRKRSIHTYAMVPLALAASLLVMLAVPQQGVNLVAPFTAVLPPVVIEPVAPASFAPVAASPGPQRVAREFPRAVPFAAAKLVEPAAVAPAPALTIASGGVTVAPPAGTRAVVMQTSDPKLVVVWLY